MPTSVEVVTAIVEALNRADVDGMLTHMDADFEWTPLESSPVARVYRGHDQVRHYVEDWLGTFESLRIDLEDPSEDGDRVTVPVRAHGRGRASGLALDSRFSQIWTVRDGVAIAMEEHP
jgi:ketosteroid isomerase-like protein